MSLLIQPIKYMSEKYKAAFLKRKIQLSATKVNASCSVWIIQISDVHISHPYFSWDIVYSTFEPRFGVLQLEKLVECGKQIPTSQLDTSVELQQQQQWRYILSIQNKMHTAATLLRKLQLMVTCVQLTPCTATQMFQEG